MSGRVKCQFRLRKMSARRKCELAAVMGELEEPRGVCTRLPSLGWAKISPDLRRKASQRLL